MESSRRRSRRTRLTEALVLAAVAITTLALASPAVARPNLHTVVYPHAMSASVMITVVCLAVIAALGLVTGVVLASRPRPRRSARPAELQESAKQASRQRAVA
jgi:hypothetical protein